MAATACVCERSLEIQGAQPDMTAATICKHASAAGLTNAADSQLGFPRSGDDIRREARRSACLEASQGFLAEAHDEGEDGCRQQV